MDQLFHSAFVCRSIISTYKYNPHLQIAYNIPNCGTGSYYVPSER